MCLPACGVGTDMTVGDGGGYRGLLLAQKLDLYIYILFNIRLERADDSNVVRFTELLAGYGLAVRVSTPTHRTGGVLDIVITRQDLPAPTINVVVTGLSDHSILLWLQLSLINLSLSLCRTSDRRRLLSRLSYVVRGARLMSTISGLCCRRRRCVSPTLGKTWMPRRRHHCTTAS